MENSIERPSDLLARAQVWNNYKHHCTAKFLIGITPQGTISYVSKYTGGRIYDKEILNLVKFLLPGKEIKVNTEDNISSYNAI